jgi:hypothetical protein
MRYPTLAELLKSAGFAAAVSLCGLLLSAAAALAGTSAPTATPTPVGSPDNPLNGPAPSSNPPSARFYGAVTVQGQPATDGTTVTALSSSGATCGTVSVGTAPAADSSYVLDDNGSDPTCSTPGSTLTFMIGSDNASTSAAATVPDGSGAVHVDLSDP